MKITGQKENDSRRRNDKNGINNVTITNNVMITMEKNYISFIKINFYIKFRAKKVIIVCKIYKIEIH